MNYDNIPDEMKQFHSWVNFKLVKRINEQGHEKLTKVPYLPSIDTEAKVNNWLHRCSFEECVNATDRYDGIGFILTDFDPYTIIDLDSPATKENLDRHNQIREAFETYQEASPSGKGTHIVARGSVPSGRRSGDMDLEIYPSKRFMTFTGNVTRDLPIADLQELLVDVYKLFPEKIHIDLDVFHHCNGPETRSDDEVISMLAAGESAKEFQKLWNGTLWANADRSSCDLSLCNMIAFRSRNIPQTIRLWHKSAIGRRPKSFRRDYIQRTISLAFDKVAEQIKQKQMVMEFCAAEIQRFTESQNQPIAIAQESPPPTPVVIPTPPQSQDSLWAGSLIPRPPGLMGLIADHALHSYIMPLHEAALATAIGVMSGMCGRAFNFRGQGLNHYVLLVSGSGTGKDMMQRTTAALFSHMKKINSDAGEFRGPNKFTSEAAIRKKFSTSKFNCFVSMMSEFGDILGRMANPRDTHANSIKNAMLEMFTLSSKGSVWGSSEYSDSANTIKEIDSPSFSFMGDTQPAVFSRCLDSESITGGFLTRLICLYGSRIPYKRFDAHRYTMNPQLSDGLSNMLYNVTTRLTAHSSDPNAICEVGIVPELDAAYRVLENQITGERIQAKGDDLEEPFRGTLMARLPGKLVRLAALCAVGVNPQDPVIDAECYDWARKVIEADVQRMLEQIESGNVIAGSIQSSQIKCLEKLCKRWISGPVTAGDKRKIPNWEALQKSCIIRSSWMTSRLTGYAAFRNSTRSTQDFQTAIRQMCLDGTLTEIDNQVVGIPGSAKHYQVNPNLLD